MQLSFNISPFEVHLIDIDISSDKRPDAAPFNLCTNIGFNQSPPVHFEANIAWGWNNCEWGFFENLAHGKSQANTNGCKMAYFGHGYGNDTPLWQYDFLD